MNRLLRLALLGGIASAASCADAPASGASDVVQAAVGPATVTADMASYTFATPVTVTYSGVPGSPLDWIAIAPQGAPLTTLTRWHYTGGGTSGSLAFEGPGTGGTYVARAFSNDTYTLVGESDPFVTADPSNTQATVAATQASYSMIDPITIAWTGLPGNARDWIAIAPVGFPVNDQAEWQYTGGGTGGSVTFPDGFVKTTFPPGTYVARAYLNDTFTLVAESTPFPIGTSTGPTISTNNTAYTPATQIAAIWAGLPGNAKDWIAIAPAGSDPTTVSQWRFTNGAVSGRLFFNTAALANGTYVARAFLDDTYTLLAESASFTVSDQTGVTVSTDLATYAVEQSIAISWTNLPGNAKDWIAYAPAGSSDTTVTRWMFTGGVKSGSLTLEGALAPGTYVARAFLDDLYTKLGESAAFVVQ